MEHRGSMEEWLTNKKTNLTKKKPIILVHIHIPLFFELGFEGKKKTNLFVILLVTYNHQIRKLYMFVLGFSLLHQCWWLVSSLSQCFHTKVFSKPSHFKTHVQNH
jgi:hypothetical protein